MKAEEIAQKVKAMASKVVEVKSINVSKQFLYNEGYDRISISVFYKDSKTGEESNFNASCHSDLPNEYDWKVLFGEVQFELEKLKVKQSKKLNQPGQSNIELDITI